MEKTLNSVLGSLPGMVWTALPDGQIDFLSQQWSEYTGLDVDVDLGKSWQAAIHAEDLPDLLERWRSALLARDASTMEARLRRFDGEYRWFAFHIRPSVDASGKIFKWCGINIDIEDRRRSEEVLRTSESYYRSIVDGIPALVTFVTPAGEVESVNRYVLEFFRTTLEELKNWKNSDIVHPSDLPAYLEAWKAGAETGEPYDVEHRIRCADGIYRWFHARKLPLKNSEGRVIRWYCMLTDIDDRKRAQALLAGEKQFLEMVAGGHSLPEILEELCLLVESTTSESYCSVVLVDPSGTRLEHGAAPSLPVSFIRSIIGRPVNVDSGPCAMATHLNEQVIAADLASETRWTAHSWPQMAMAHGLRACWSTPILSATGKALGAFAIYYNEPKAPSPQHLSLIERFSHIASIAIERTQNDTALKSSEARKTAILDSAIDCIVTIDHEGRITEFNPAAEHTFGYCRGEVLGRELADVIVPPSLREMHRQGVARCRATGEAQMLLGRRAEMTAVRADGSEFPVEITISRIPLEGPPAFTGYLRDITERKQSEERILRSEALLAEAQHLSSTGSFFCPRAGEFTWSEELYRIFEFEQGVPITFELIKSRYHPEDVPLLNDIIDQTQRGVGDFDYEHRIVMPDQSIRYVHVVAHGNRNKDGQLEHVGAVQDVTERRRSEAALSKARSELAHVARVTSLGVLTASIAHEVSQPLSGIITNASTCLRMLAADPPNVDGARETARRTIRDGNRASDVITRLRALFGKKDDTATDLVDLNGATREVIALSLSELQRGQVILRTEFAADLPHFSGDRVQIQQVILNLIRNAADAMNDVDDRPRQLIIRTESDQNDHVRLTVEDAGVGFELQEAERFFEAFYTTKSDGMGIGLSVSRSIIERLQGRLWAAPNDGPGATFAFSIPCSPKRKTDTYSFNVRQTHAMTDTHHVIGNS